jgi:biopolymer transport protein ExbD
MAFLRKGFLRSANRRNELYCRIDPAPIAAIFFAFVGLFLGDVAYPHAHSMVFVDRASATHARSLPKALREDAILISVTRDGSVYVRNTRLHPAELPNKIRDSVLNGAEKRIYLQVDARAKYGDVKALLPFIQLSGVENVTFLTETPYHGHF